MSGERILFVTGRLAEYSLRRVLSRLADTRGLDYEVIVLPISVAALLNVDWLLRKLQMPEQIDRVVLPGWCRGDLSRVRGELGLPAELGPKDLRDLPEYLGDTNDHLEGYGEYDMEILAEINHAPHLSDEQILAEATRLRDNGADVIDVGCVPGETSHCTGEIVGMLRREGFRISIDSFDRDEVEAAVTAGAELVLSCNTSNRDWLADVGAELVVIPDNPRELDGLAETITFLQDRKVPFRVDPVLEPIGFGFAQSLGRYLAVRRDWPDVEMMMGIGNLTELTEVDSAGINVMLAGFCAETRIRSVLTTEVINWCRSAVQELDVARRLVAARG